MAKKGKIVRTQPSVYDPPPYTAEEQETDYKRGYEFNKPVPGRSPVDGWSYKYINEGQADHTPKKEVSLVKGQPHSFKAMRLGNRYSSRPAGHRIGKR